MKIKTTPKVKPAVFMGRPVRPVEVRYKELALACEDVLNNSFLLVDCFCEEDEVGGTHGECMTCRISDAVAEFLRSPEYG